MKRINSVGKNRNTKDAPQEETAEARLSALNSNKTKKLHPDGTLEKRKWGDVTYLA